MWGWGAPGSRGQLPPHKPEDEAGRWASEQRRTRRRPSPLSLVLLVVVVAVVVTLAALFVVYLT